MYAFTFERPASAGRRRQAGAAGGKLLAGGQTLLASMKLRLAAPSSWSTWAASPSWPASPDGNAMWSIGAMTRHADVAKNADVKAGHPRAGRPGRRHWRPPGARHGHDGRLGRQQRPFGLLPQRPCWAWAPRCTPTQRKIAADDFFQGMFTTALKDGELITAISFPHPKRAAYMKFKQPASRFALIGVFVAQTDSGVRVAVTGGGNGVFRHKGLEDALSKSFTPEAAAAVKIDAGELSSDLHASAAYRANLISVMTQRAVAKALA
jgi:carbon-monoxide dehydrogenase medium subunit